MSSRIGQSQVMSRYTIVPIGIIRIQEDLDSPVRAMKMAKDGIMMNPLFNTIDEI